MSVVEGDDALSAGAIKEFQIKSFQKESPLGRAIMARIIMGIATELEESLFTKEERATAKLLSDAQLMQEIDEGKLLGS